MKPLKPMSIGSVTGGLGQGFGGGVGFRIAKPPEKIEDPLADVEYTGNEETDCKAELTALQQGFRERRAREQKRFERATDTEFWCAVVFHTREQKEAFLTALRILADGDKYVDGLKLAKSLNITLPE